MGQGGSLAADHVGVPARPADAGWCARPRLRPQLRHGLGPGPRLTRDALGLGTSLPRAVPSDAVVAVLDEVVGGAVLQKVVLLATLVAAGAGAAALVRTRTRRSAGGGHRRRVEPVRRGAPGDRVTGRSCRLRGAAMGPPRCERRRRRRGVMPARLPVLLLLGSLSASDRPGHGCRDVCGRAGAHRAPLGALMLLVAAANAPWVVSGLAHAADATSSSVGADVFAPSSREGLLRAPLQFLTLGGVWNAEVGAPVALRCARPSALTVRAGRCSAAGRSCAAGGRRCRRAAAAAGRAAGRSGWLSLVVTWALPGATGGSASTCPGAGCCATGRGCSRWPHL